MRQRRGILQGLFFLLSSFLSPRPSRARDHAPLAKPESPGSWAPLETFAGRAFFVMLDVGGRSLPAVIDTGATVTLMDVQLAADLGLKAIAGSFDVRSDTQTGRLDRLEPFSARIAGAEISFVHVGVTDLTPISLSFGRRIGLVLGRDFFQSQLVDLDPPNQRYRLLQSAPSAPPGAERLALGHGEAGSRTVEVSLEGRAPIAAVFDLGSSNPVMLSRAYAEGQGLLMGKRLSSAATAQVTGVVISTTCSLKTVRLGASTLAEVPCEVFDEWRSPAVPANIGLPVLSRFRMILDYRQDTLWLIPSPERVLAPFERDLSGLGFAVLPDRLKVVHVAKNGPAEGVWRIGDEIVRVDDRPVDATYVQSGLWRWRYGSLGPAVRLTLADGSTRALQLSVYY